MANPKTRVALEMIDPQPMSAVEINNTFAPLDSATLVGTPTAPTADVNSPGSDQLATTNYVKNSISALVASAPTTLDTLNELAAALGNDPNFATTVTSNLGNKVDTNSANYLKSVSISNDNKTITFTKGNGSTVIITPHDTTYTAGSRITISGTTIAANDQLPSRSNNAGKVLRVSSNNSSVEWSAERPTSLVLGGSSATTNSTSDVSNPYLNTVENSAKVGSVQFVGSGATSIKAKNGIITITSTDTDTKYSHPTYTARIGKPTTNLTPKFGDTITISQIVSNGTGHVTAANDKTIKIPADGPTTTLKGLMPALKNNTSLYLRSDGQWATPPDTNTTYTAATANPKAPGTAAVGSSAKYAREDHVHPLQTSISGNASTATKLANSRSITVKITLNGNTLTASGSFDGSGNLTLDLGSLTSAQLTGGSSSGGCSGCSCSGECNSREYEGCCCDCAGE